MAVATPRVEVVHKELITDHIGQRWSPAKVRFTWPVAEGLPGPPCVEVSVIALARAEMDRNELDKAHLQAAHGVLEAALLSAERTVEKLVPMLWPGPSD